MFRMCVRLVAAGVVALGGFAIWLGDSSVLWPGLRILGGVAVVLCAYAGTVRIRAFLVLTLIKLYHHVLRH